MYFVKYGNEYLHDPRVDGRIILDLSLDGEENSCGFCDFTIYPSHPMYDKLRERDADNPIRIYDDSILLFTGFIYELGKEFYLDGHVKCKGELDYLSESIIRPYSTLDKGYGLKAPSTVTGYFNWLIEQHNNQVQPNKQFTVGINQASYLDNSISYFSENVDYPTTMAEIKEKLLDTIGGYLVTRNVNGVRYIDYLSEWTDSNSQILDFGINLTDYTQTDDSLELATFVVPIGAKLSETEYEYDDGYFVSQDASPSSTKEYYTQSENGYSKCSDDLVAFEAGVTYYEYDENEDESNLSLTVDGLADVSTEPDYIKDNDVVYCQSAVLKYGWIGFTFKNTELKTKRELIDEGIIALKERISPKRTIEIKAVDMHLVNKDIKPIRIGEYVRVRSKPHKLDSYFLCASIDLDLNNPENSLYTLGTTFDTLTGQQNKQINALNKTINKQYEESTKIYEVTDKQTNEIKQIAHEARDVAYTSVSSIEDEYAISESTSDAPQIGWSTTVPTRIDGTFIWRRQVSTYANGTSINSAPVLVTGDRGEDAITLTITSSAGTIFKNSAITTTLTAHVYKAGVEVTGAALTALGTIKWYKDGAATAIATGTSLDISAGDVTNKATYVAQLEG